MRIYLIRHGESRANVDPEIYKTIADHAIPVSPLGEIQPVRAGMFLAEDLEKVCSEQAENKFDKEHIRVWFPPYKRTRQTKDGVVQGIHEYFEGRELPFYLDEREDIRLCEQQFGLFDGIPEEDWHKVFPDEAAHYKKCEDHEGRFWARMPLGESRFDVATRVKNTFDSFYRDLETRGIKTIIIVCHGVSLRAFVMQWLHYPPEWFDAEPNPGNCDIRLIDRGKDQHHEDFGYIYRGILST